MTKPAVTLYNVKGSPLTTSELDTNFTNLRDSTVNFTGDAGDTRSMDLNDTTAITGNKNIQVTVSESGQSIVVKNTLSDYSLDPMGFENHSDSVISFNSGSRTFTIAPASGTFRYWYQGTQYNKTSTETVTVPATTGLYLIYYTGSTLSATTSEIDWGTMTPVAHVYWNNTASTFIITDERHGIHMSRGSKEYLHQTQGAAYSSGLIASNYTTTGTGNTNSDAQLDLSSGIIYDQEHRVEITHSNSPTANTYQQDLQGPGQFPVLYKLNGAWTLDAVRDYPVKNGTSLVTYNLNTAGTWSTPDATSTHYVAYWLVATNALNSPVISIMGQRSDNKLSDAETNNTWSSLDFTDFPIDELRPLYRLIFRTASTYTNGAKAYLAKIDDYRYSTVIPTAGIATTNSFANIAVSGQSTVQADAVDDTLTLVAGTGINISTDATTDTITIVATGSVSGALLNVVEDTTPQLGGNLDVNGHSIVSVSNGNIVISPNGTGKVILDGLSWPSSDGSFGYVLQTDGAGNLSWTANPADVLSNELTSNLDTKNYYLYSSIGNIQANDDIAFVNTTTATGPTGNTTNGLLIRDSAVNNTNITLTSSSVSINGPLNVSAWNTVPQWWFRGLLNTDVTLTASTDNNVNWTTTSDPLSWYNATNQRVTPGRIGWYQVLYKINYSGLNSSNQFNTQIRVNGSNVGIAVSSINTGQYTTITNVGMLYLSNTSDYFTFTVYPQGSSQTLQGGAQGCTVIVRWISN